MKRFVFLVGLVVVAFAVTILAQTGAKPKGETAEQELVRLENTWNDAFVKHDWAFIDHILADDHLMTDFEGTIIAKAEFLRRLKTGEETYTSVVGENIKARVYGDAAVVMGLNTEKSQYKGKDTSGKYQWTDTWVKKAGRWQCVASHVSKIAAK